MWGLLTLAQQAVETSSEGAAGAAGALVGGVFGCVFLLIGLVLFAFWVWMLVDAITRTFKDSTEKIIWVLVIVFTGIIGAAIYFFIGRSRGTKGAVAG